MNDTSPAVKVKMQEMMKQKSPQERLAMGCSMYDMSKQIVVSSILQQTPKISAAELRRKLFLRFYGNDFDAVRSEEILKQLT